MSLDIPSHNGAPVANGSRPPGRARVRCLDPVRSVIATRPELAVDPKPPEFTVSGQPAVDAAARPDDRAEWCSIVFAMTQGTGEFRAIEVLKTRPRRVIERSRPFRVPLTYRTSWRREIPNRGKPRRTYNELVQRLVDAGWRQLDTRGRWHDTAFAKTLVPSRQSPSERVSSQRGGGAARTGRRSQAGA
jgi:hypothetical protein